MRIGWRGTDGARREGGLFEVFAALSRDEVATFPALRPHQRMPWHAFCVQAAALALHRAGRDDPPREAGAWRDLLIGLTPDWPGGEAWELVVKDWSKPALLQPPVCSRAKGDFKGELLSADRLDMLATSKNHDIKREALLSQATDDHWLFALMTLQTQEGMLKASSSAAPGYHGISRMDGFYGNRPGMRVSASARPGADFRRDTKRLLEVRNQLLHDYEHFHDDGDGVLWVLSWNGCARPFSNLDPFYIEICRRVRLVDTEGARCAKLAGSREAFFHGLKERRGLTGDPWAPITEKSRSASRTGEEGYGYKVVAALLNPKVHRRPALSNLVKSDATEGLALVFSGIRRDQGKTGGYHERRIPVSRRARNLFGSTLGGAMLDRAGGVAEARAGEAGRMGDHLWLALFVLLRSETEDDLTRGEASKQRGRLARDHKATEAKIARWIGLFDHKVDAGFFDEAFWDEVSEEQHGAAAGGLRRAWRERLRKAASEVLDAAAREAPRNQARRFKALARAKNVFEHRTKTFERDGQ